MPITDIGYELGLYSLAVSCFVLFMISWYISYGGQRSSAAKSCGRRSGWGALRVNLVNWAFVSLVGSLLFTVLVYVIRLGFHPIFQYEAGWRWMLVLDYGSRVAFVGLGFGHVFPKLLSMARRKTYFWEKSLHQA